MTSSDKAMLLRRFDILCDDGNLIDRKIAVMETLNCRFSCLEGWINVYQILLCHFEYSLFLIRI